VFIYAAGGLGNQLFQLAAGYSIHSGREIVCEVGFSGPRKKLHTTSVLSNLSLDDCIVLRSSERYARITQRFLDYLLRVSTKTKGPESTWVFRIIISFLGSLYFSFYYKCFLLLSLSKGVGYWHLPKYKTNQMIIGYFQSYRYLDEQAKFTFLNMFTLREHGPDWDYWSSRAIKDKPIIVHIRLGDYLSEESFGIVTTDYISESLALLNASSSVQPIWVFSDQKDLAEELFPQEFLADAVWIPEIDSNPMATLSIMRLGTGYVIANSTFSWWAAWSSQIVEAPVFCPHPWFSRSETPRDLIPEVWIEIDTNVKIYK
jgi:hypothetical protein